MTLERVKDTSLWGNSLGKNVDDQYQDKIEELRSSLLKFRENASVLVAQISKALPGLTQHDISHLDALWETASIICGQNYPLNPLEAFVLGGAFLLHDSALCFEAYENGVTGIRETVTWQDHFAQLADAHEGNNTDALYEMADFNTIRSLHASQAEKLGELSWRDPKTQQELYLIENSTLRIHLGKWIGLIAGSHHWPIEDIQAKLPHQLNSLSSYPREWRVDPVKIACILRCADAAHIDNERAPDFLHALIKRRGISYQHWQAQNKLANVDIDLSDSSFSTLLFTSTSPFKEDESEAWWVVYDTTCMIDKEIRDSNALLKSRNMPTPEFSVRRVKGVESPELMSKHVQTEGWSPCSAEVHVSNIEGLVNTLGGEKLYGSGNDKLEIVLRELIQNSRDSIHARRELNKGYIGKITIRLKTIDGKKWIYVEDDGIGMSKRVLTGPLLDFGTSFWTSSLVKSELPGLRSSKFRSVGKFGIGFYSIFMCSCRVRVASRQWNGGTQDVWQVYFKNGLSLRPILKNSIPLDYPHGVSTQVSIQLNDETILEPQIIRRGRLGSTDIEVNFSDYISAICAGLDVPAYLANEDQTETEVHHENIHDNASAWLKTISFSNYQDGKISSYIENNSARLRPIIENGRCHGMAALSTLIDHEANFLSVKTVGGLSTTVHCRDSDCFIGYLDYLPKSAKRESLSFSASENAVKQWAEEQKRIINYGSLTPVEKYVAASSLCKFGVDPIDVASIAVAIDKSIRFLSFAELADLALNMPICILRSSYMRHIETHITTDFIEGVALIRPLKNGEFLSLEMNGERPKNDNCILGCLYRAIEASNCRVLNSEQDTAIRSPLGPIKALIILAEKIQ